MATMISLHDKNETQVLLEYCWKHKMLSDIETTDSKEIEVLDPGLYNRHEGPTFFNAKVKINRSLWVGNVTILGKSSDWNRQNLDNNRQYDNTILVVCGEFDGFTQNTKGDTISVVCQEVPEKVRENYQKLMENNTRPACYSVIPNLTTLCTHAWLAALQTERMEQKTQSIRARAERFTPWGKGGNWNKAYFITIARSFGFGHDSDIYEEWAEKIPMEVINKHRDDLFQIEAIFLGVAGLLELDMIPEKYQKVALNEGYFAKLRNEYIYLTHKYSLESIDGRKWNTKGVLPQNYPHIRISQMANLYYSTKAGMEMIIGCEHLSEIKERLSTHVTPYWESHYIFGAFKNEKCEKRLSMSSVNLLIVNAIVPFFFAYGRYKGEETLCDRAFDFCDMLKAEKNSVTKMWGKVGIKCNTAGDSQALVQMQHHYCDKKNCLRCRFGYEYIKQTN